MIETIVDTEHDLTIFKCSGILTDDELNKATRLFYDENPTMNVMWDFSESSHEAISTAFIKQSAMLVKRLARDTGKGSKIAAIAPKALDYGMARMFQIMSDTDDSPFKIQIFRTLEEARQWMLPKE